jgi:hypothetical protein
VGKKKVNNILVDKPNKSGSNLPHALRSHHGKTPTISAATMSTMASRVNSGSRSM